MNTRIEQLTRNYLNSLPYYRFLDNNQKQRIIEINNQSEWIIFNAGSLKGTPNTLSHYAPSRTQSAEVYKIVSSDLKEMLQEAIKIYPKEDLDLNDVEVKFFMFYGGYGDRVDGGGHIHKIDAVPFTYGDRTDHAFWIAVNKKEVGERFEDYIMANDVCLNNDRRHWKKSRNLVDLLNDNDIISSHERNQSASSSAGSSLGTNPPPSSPPSPRSTTQTIQFTIKSVEKYDVDINLFNVEIDSPITVNNQQVTSVEITGRKADDAYQNGTLQAGKTIIITNVQISPGRSFINNYGELSIDKRSYDDIQVVSSTTPPPTTPPPDSPPIPPSFPETRQKNQELNQENNKMDLLAEELLKVIEDNNQVCQEAQQLGLNLPEIPSDALNYFQEESFEQLDENQPLNSPDNEQINTENENTRQKKLNIKKNIYGIYDNNKKKLAEGKNGQTTPPKNELEKSKEELKERINQVLTNKDNLRNIDLSTLADGKYQNWEKDIEGLTTQDEVVAYANAFLAALKEIGAKEEGRKKKGKGNKTNSNNSQNSENNTIDDKTKKMINNLPLAAAKNVAKNKVRELFNKYNPDLEKLKELWGGEKNWMAYLEKCDSPEKVVAFLEKLERAMLAQQVQSQGNNKNKKPTPKNSWILPLLIIVLVALISLVIIIKIRYKRKGQGNI